MSASETDSLERFGCVLIVRKGASQVVIEASLVKDYNRLDATARARMERVMELWCEERALTKAMFNGNEGRSAKGKMLQAIKAFRVRLYGFVTQLDGRRSFVIVDYDAAKKQDPADQNILKRAKGRVDGFGKEKAK
jgi:hypothetical protein